MHTVVGGLRSYSPDKNYVLGSTAHGASAKAFTALTKKRIYLWIDTAPKYGDYGVTNKPVTLFERKYVFTVADLGMHVQWSSAELVSVDLYDYGDGVSLFDRQGQPSNHVATLRFELDRQSGRFQEKAP